MIRRALFVKTFHVDRIQLVRHFHPTRLATTRRWSRWEWPHHPSSSSGSSYEKTDHEYHEQQRLYEPFSFFRDVFLTTTVSLGLVAGIYGSYVWYERRREKKWREGGSVRKLSYLFPSRMRHSYYSWKDVHSWQDLKLYLKKTYQNIPNGTFVSVSLVALNSAVFLIWKIPKTRLQFWMNNYFVHNVHKRSFVAQIASIPLCTFSHRDGYHLIFNMMAGTSFLPILLHDLSIAHFWAFYVSSGIVSTLCSHLGRYVTGSTAGGLGASGAIMAIVGYTISRFYHIEPERKFVSLIFLPFIQFNAEQAFYAILAAELGMFLFSKRVRIDHIAHLSGLAIGCSYYRWGKQIT